MKFKNLFKRAPIWCNSILLKRKDILSMRDVYKTFEIPVRPGMEKIFKKVKKDKKYKVTLFDQVVLVKYFLADMAGGVFNKALFEILEEDTYADLVIDCSHDLYKANKYYRV